MVKVIYHTIRNCSFFPLREVPILKRDAIEENHCSIQESTFDVRNFFSVLATPLWMEPPIRHCGWNPLCCRLQSSMAVNLTSDQGRYENLRNSFSVLGWML